MTYNDEQKKRFLRRIANRQRLPRKKHEKIDLIQSGLSGEAQDHVYWDFLVAWDKLNEQYDRYGNQLFEFEEYLFALLGLPKSFYDEDFGDVRDVEDGLGD